MNTTTANNEQQHFAGGTNDHGAHHPGPTNVKRLVRKNGSLSGVAGGMADYAGVDPTLVRLGIAIGSILTFPVIPLAYVAAWAIMPEEQAPSFAAPTPPPPAPAPTPPAAAAASADVVVPTPNPAAAPGAVSDSKTDQKTDQKNDGEKSGDEQ